MENPACWYGAQGDCFSVNEDETVGMDPVDADAATLCFKHAEDLLVEQLTQPAWREGPDKRALVNRILARVLLRDG